MSGYGPHQEAFSLDELDDAFPDKLVYIHLDLGGDSVSSSDGLVGRDGYIFPLMNRALQHEWREWLTEYLAWSGDGAGEIVPEARADFPRHAFNRRGRHIARRAQEGSANGWRFIYRPLTDLTRRNDLSLGQLAFDQAALLADSWDRRVYENRYVLKYPELERAARAVSDSMAYFATLHARYVGGRS